MKLRCLSGALLIALSGLAFAAEPSVVTVDKSMNVEVVTVQSLLDVQTVDSLDVLEVEISSLDQAGVTVTVEQVAGNSASPLAGDESRTVVAASLSENRNRQLARNGESVTVDETLHETT
jgi:hypothetical protein